MASFRKKMKKTVNNETIILILQYNICLNINENLINLQMQSIKLKHD